MRSEPEPAPTARLVSMRRCFETAGTLLVVIGTDHKVQDINPHAAAVLGRPPTALVGQDWSGLFLPRHRADVAGSLAACAVGENAGAQATCEARMVRPDGEERLLFWRTTAARDDRGQLIALIVAGEDITERMRREADQREREIRLRDALACSTIVVFNPHSELRYIWVHHPVLGLVTEALGSPGPELRPLDALEREAAGHEGTGSGGHGGRPPPDAAAGPARGRSTRGRSKRLRQRPGTGELNSRTKRMFELAQGLALQSLQHGHAPMLANEMFAERIRVLANAHSLLAGGEWRGDSLRQILEVEIGAHGQSAEVIGPDVTLTPQATLTLALVLHELATNAARHGAFAVPGGRLTVTWRLAWSQARGRELRLCWHEWNVLAPRKPVRRGFGQAIIERGLERELGGAVTVEYRADGILCELIIPASSALGAELLTLPRP